MAGRAPLANLSQFPGVAVEKTRELALLNGKKEQTYYK